MRFISVKRYTIAEPDITNTIEVMPEGFLEQVFGCSFCDEGKSYFDEDLPRKILDYLLESPVVIFAKRETYSTYPTTRQQITYNQCYETFVLDFERRFRREIERGEVVVWLDVHFFNYHKVIYRSVNMGDQYGNAFRNKLIDNILDEI